ncbi:hypothetical protein QAD02_017916, partial [Eretmocerus hayati]
MSDKQDFLMVSKVYGLWIVLLASSKLIRAAPLVPGYSCLDVRLHNSFPIVPKSPWQYYNTSFLLFDVQPIIIISSTSASEFDFEETGVAGEIDVSIKIPTAVAENSTVVMVCNYDLHKMPLYSVKWYKSQREFYRYIPKEMPSKSVFGTLGAKVDFNMSDSHHVVLNNVEPNLAGKYRCEVTTDLPDFTTRTESSYMFVV